MAFLALGNPYAYPPFEVHSWMDSSWQLHSVLPPPLVTLAFAAPVAAALVARNRWALGYAGLAVLVWACHSFSAGLPFVENLFWYGCALLLSLPFFLHDVFRRKGATTRHKVAAASAAATLLLLVAMGFPRMRRFQPSLCAAALQNAAQGVQGYWSDHGQPPTSTAQLAPDYLRQEPHCQGPGSPGYELRAGELSVVITCTNPVHSQAGQKPSRVTVPAPVSP
jgi:hypothetical protein